MEKKYPVGCCQMDFHVGLLAKHFEYGRERENGE